MMTERSDGSEGGSPSLELKIEYGDELILKPSVTGEGMLLRVRDVEEGQSIGVYLNETSIHALADWIIANVPKPEPTPLPTKFAAVVKSGGILWTRAFNDDDPWVNAVTASWKPGEYLQQQGFEVIFEGVDGDPWAER